MKNIFNVSEEEKNRIRRLHLTESTNKKISSVLEEGPYPQFSAGHDPDFPDWFRDDCMEWSYGGWGDATKNTPGPVCTKAPNQGKAIDARFCGDWDQNAAYAMVVLGISCAECCGGDSTDATSDICNERCAKGCPDQVYGQPTTAVLSWCWNGSRCRQLSSGGGPFHSMEECEECNCSGVGIDDIKDIEFEYKIEDRYSDCISQTYFSNPVGPLPDLKQGDYYNYCMTEKYYGLPITTREYVWQGKLLGVSKEVCCGDKDITDNINIDDIDIDVDVDQDRRRDDTRKRKGCRWTPEPIDEPTLGSNGYSINNIRICHEGENVKLIQQVLLEEGYDLGKSGPNGDGVDGKFGKKTKKAVQDYQRKYDLPISCDPNCDGIVGDETWKHMFAEEDLEDVITSGEGCTEIQLILGMEPVPGGGCECPPGTEENENGKCVEIEDDADLIDDFDDFIEDNLEKKTKRLECRDMIRKLSKKIKRSSADTIQDLVNNEELKITLGYCLDERNYPLIAGHVKRIKKHFGLEGKGNI